MTTVDPATTMPPFEQFEECRALNATELEYVGGQATGTPSGQPATLVWFRTYNAQGMLDDLTVVHASLPGMIGRTGRVGFRPTAGDPQNIAARMNSPRDEVLMGALRDRGVDRVLSDGPLGNRDDAAYGLRLRYWAGNLIASVGTHERGPAEIGHLLSILDAALAGFNNLLAANWPPVEALDASVIVDSLPDPARHAYASERGFTAEVPTWAQEELARFGVLCTPHASFIAKLDDGRPLRLASVSRYVAGPAAAGGPRAPISTVDLDVAVAALAPHEHAKLQSQVMPPGGRLAGAFLIIERPSSDPSLNAPGLDAVRTLTQQVVASLA